jgi:hypothetical protein
MPAVWRDIVLGFDCAVDEEVVWSGWGMVEADGFWSRRER